MLILLILTTLSFWIALIYSCLQPEDVCEESQPSNISATEPKTPFDLVPYSLAGIAPSIVCIIMSYLFYIVGFARTVQFNAGSESAMRAWSTWVDLWPALMLLTSATAFVSLIATITFACMKSKRDLLPPAAVSFLFSGFAFITVTAHFPSAYHVDDMKEKDASGWLCEVASVLNDRATLLPAMSLASRAGITSKAEE